MREIGERLTIFETTLRISHGTKGEKFTRLVGCTADDESPLQLIRTDRDAHARAVISATIFFFR